MQPAVPAPQVNGRPVRIPTCSDAPRGPVRRNNGDMSQPDAQAQVQHAQPSVGSIAAHRPHTVSAAVSDLEAVAAVLAAQGDDP
ncbi:RNA degradosome polyphosphate kinase, partial [Streptomyces sp. NPDC002454]